ncbi:MAG: hypothetical protein ACE14W_07870 [Candidatus Velamenicoccus archaeovorus]
MARKKQTPVAQEDARTVGALLRGLRRAAGFRAVQDAADAPGCPAARQTIYAYERGALTPSLKQFLELVEFYALGSHPARPAKAPEDLRAQAVAAVQRALQLPAYHVVTAIDLMARLQPPLRTKRSP